MWGWTNVIISVRILGLIVLLVSAAECVSCILSAVWNCSHNKQYPLCPQRCAVSPLSSSLYPAFIQHSDHTTCNSDIGLLLTPAISSTVLRNALFSHSPWNDGQSMQAHWFTSCKVFSCPPNGHVFLFCCHCSYEWLPDSYLKDIKRLMINIQWSKSF